MEPDPETLFLQRLALNAASMAGTDDLVRLVVAETTEALDADVCSVYLLDPADGRLVLTATNGLSQAGVGRVRLAVGEGVTGWAAQDLRPAVVVDVRAEPRFRWLDEVDQARFVSMCSVPIAVAERLVGVLNVQTERRRDFSGADVGFLAAIAEHVARVLARVGRWPAPQTPPADTATSPAASTSPAGPGPPSSRPPGSPPSAAPA